MIIINFIIDLFCRRGLFRRGWAGTRIKMEVFLDLFLVSILFSESLGETVTGGDDLSFGVFNLPELDSKSYELVIDASPLTETILLSEEKREPLGNEVRKQHINYYLLLFL